MIKLQYLLVCLIFIKCSNNLQHKNINREAFEYYLNEMNKLNLLKADNIFLLRSVKTCEYCKNNINDIRNYLASNMYREKVVLISTYNDSDIQGYKDVIFDTGSVYMSYVFPKSYITFYAYSSKELEYTFINSIEDARNYLIKNSLIKI